MSTLVRASSLPDLFDCPARWEAKYIYGKRMPMSGKAALGKAIHASTGAFDAARILHSPISIDDAASAAVDALRKPDEETQWDDDSVDKAELVALALHTKYCTHVAPVQDYVAVEAKCEALTITDLDITLTGTIDRVYRADDGSLGISDIKTGKTAVGTDGKAKTQGHSLQLATYELLAEIAIQEHISAPAQIVGMQTGQTDKAQRIAIGEVEDARELLVGSTENPGALQHVARFIKSGAFYGNPRSPLCYPKYCPVYGQCNYRK
jgi:RecB family exonuclease